MMSLSWPLLPGQRSWRYGVVGLVAGGLYNPLIATLIAFAAASEADQRPVMAFIGGLSVIAGFACIAMAGVFSIDFPELQALAAQGPNARAVQRANVQVLVKLASGSFGFLFIGGLVWKQWVDSRRAARRSAPREKGVIAASARVNTGRD